MNTAERCKRLDIRLLYPLYLSQTDEMSKNKSVIFNEDLIVNNKVGTIGEREKLVEYTFSALLDLEICGNIVYVQL